MKVSPKTGQIRERQFFVSRDQCVEFDGLYLLSTPHLLWELEHCALEFLQESLEVGELSLGVHLDVEHRAVAVELESVVCYAKVVYREGPLLTFHISAESNGECLAQGLHKRRVVKRASLKSRLESRRLRNVQSS